MDFKQLRSFLTVADTGSVTRGAELLHLVQPAVSRQLKLLEEDLGTALFERARSGMELTTAGRALVNYARRAMLELDRARAEIGAADGDVTGLVTIGLLPSVCDLLASALVSAVASRYPGIQLRIAMGYAGTLQGWLEGGEVDAALLYDPKHLQGIQTESLLEESLWVVGLPAHKLSRKRPVSIASLRGKPMILPSPPHGIRMLVDHACAARDVKLTIATETNSMSIQKSLVLGGHGLTILPAIAVADDIARNRFTAAPLKDPTITRRIVLALPSNRPTSPPVRRAVHELVQCVKEATQRGDWLEARWLAE